MLFSQPFLGVYSGLEVPLFGVVRKNPVVVGHWEAILHDVVNVYLGGVEQLGNMFISFHIMVVVILPVFGILSIPFNHNEVCVQQQDNVIFHLLLVKRYSYRLHVLVLEGVHQQCWLNH